MAANVESMFYVRETPWHGLGTKVAEAPCSKEALRLSGLDWNVVQEPIYTATDELIEGYKANEIADITNSSPAAVRKQLQHGRKMLKFALERSEADENK